MDQPLEGRPMKKLATIALSVTALIGLAACGSDKADYHAKVDDAIYMAQATGAMRTDLEPDLRADLIDSYADACAGDNNAEISVRMSINTGGAIARSATAVMSEACPARFRGDHLVSREWLMRAWVTITIFWVLWLGALTWSGVHRKTVLTFGNRVVGTMDDPVSFGEYLGHAWVGTAVALFLAFLAWLWLRPAKAEQT